MSNKTITKIDPLAVYIYCAGGDGVPGLPKTCTLKEAQDRQLANEFLAAIGNGSYKPADETAVTKGE